MANVPTDAKELFDKQVPDAIAKNPDKAKEINAVYLFKITGDDGGEWTVDLASATPFCKSGVHGTAQCTVEVAHSDFKSMLTNPALGMQLYFQGKLRVTGDPMLATRLQKLFTIGSDAGAV
jgi:alkyl sulfatase BDS1-like metallo-beta-lactamase superfamily hydrolase